MTKSIIEARDVCYQYEGESALAVDHVSLDIRVSHRFSY